VSGERPVTIAASSMILPVELPEGKTSGSSCGLMFKKISISSHHFFYLISK